MVIIKNTPWEAGGADYFRLYNQLQTNTRQQRKHSDVTLFALSLKNSVSPRTENVLSSATLSRNYYSFCVRNYSRFIFTFGFYLTRYFKVRLDFKVVACMLLPLKLWQPRSRCCELVLLGFEGAAIHINDLQSSSNQLTKRCWRLLFLFYFLQEIIKCHKTSHFSSSATALTFFSVGVVHVLSVAMQIFALQTVKSFLWTHFPGLNMTAFVHLSQGSRKTFQIFLVLIWAFNHSIKLLHYLV